MSGRAGFLEDKVDPFDPAKDENAFVLSLLPYEETTTYRQGAARAPEAIVAASGHLELFDETLKFDPSVDGILTVRPDVTDLASVTRHVQEIRLRYPGAFHGFIGGEHSLTPAIVEAFAGEGELGIVWIDAHADLRESFHGRADNHACAGFNSLPFGPIVQIGVRTLAEEEWELIEASDKVSTFPKWGEEAREAIQRLPERVYLSIDFDGFSPEVIRSVGTPEPGGLYWEDMMEVLATVFDTREVLGFDAVELCPNPSDHTSDFIAARLVYKVLTYHAWHRLGGR
jgi:agmatinase